MCDFFKFKFVFLLVLYNLTCVCTYEKKEACVKAVDFDISRHFSSKTPYRVIANHEVNYDFPGCKPTRIWSIIRHGSRNPAKKLIVFAKNNLTRLRDVILENNETRLCKEERDRLRLWSFNVSVEEEKYLVPEGEEELVELAERMQKRFPDILPDNYDPSLYYMKFTATQRTLKSAKSFATGLFGRHNIGQIQFPKPMHKDPVLRFYKLCKRWKHDVDKNPETFDNAKKFLHGPEFEKALQFISQTINMNVTPTEAQQIFTVCAFETAWQKHKAPSPWCSLFNNETIKLLEFAEDLEYYWNDGYGYNLTQKIGCPAIADMFEAIDPASKRPNATLYFTHSGTLLKLLAHLGLYKDAQPLTYKDFNKTRLWKTSQIDAFATNLSFVLYECTDDDTPKVLVLHQERPVDIANCGKGKLCSLKHLRETFEANREKCNFEEICHLN